jgi:hypothetical protein
LAQGVLCPESNLVNDAVQAGPRDCNFGSIDESDVPIVAICGGSC